MFRSNAISCAAAKHVVLAAVLSHLFAIAAVAQSTAKTEPDRHLYDAYTQSYSIPFTKTEDFTHLDHTLHIKASINGGPASGFTIDTGSIGIVVSADEVPNIDPNAKEGVLRYSSSGVELHGVWTTATVTFPDSKGPDGKPAQAVVPVLAVNKSLCTGSGVNAAICRESDNPHPHMFGVGFNRGTEPHPEKNPFLNLKEMTAGTMRRGYLITPKGIQLGLTADTVGDGFIYQKLEPVETTTAVKDWKTSPGSFQMKNLRSGKGTILMDTGLTNMMLAVPNGPPSGDVPAGTPMTIQLLDGKLNYSFTVGDTSGPTTPRRVSWVRASHGVYVNTGLRVLANFDYMYDADGGYLALRPVKR